MLADLGAVLRERGKYWRAESVLSRSLEMRRRLLAPNSPMIAAGLDDLGQIYLATGRYPAAVHSFTEALGLSRGRVGADGPNAARVAEHLAQAQRAESLLIRALLAVGAALFVLITHFVVSGFPAHAQLPDAVRKLSAIIRIVGWVLFLAGAAFLGGLLVWPWLRWVLPLSLSQEVAAAFGYGFALLTAFFAAGGLIGLLTLLRIALGRSEPSQEGADSYERGTPVRA
jgi:hypothetical protein